MNRMIMINSMKASPVLYSVTKLQVFTCYYVSQLPEKVEIIPRKFDGKRNA
jgi:hypothetical protein